MLLASRAPGPVQSASLPSADRASVQRFTSLLATAGALALLAVPAAGQTAPTVTRFPATLPTGSTCPSFTAPVQARDGTMWFFGVNFAQPFRITPTGNVVTLPDQSAGASCLLEAAAATDGNIWGGTIGDESLVRFAPDGAATRFEEGPNATDTVAADDGNVWATSFEGGLVGRMTTGGTFTPFPVGQPQGGLGAIAAGPDGNVWFTKAGGIGRVTPAGVITEFDGEGLNPRDIAAGPDGNLWITQGAGQPVVRRTLDGTITPFSDPEVTLGGGNRITVGADGNLWINDPANQRAVRVTPAGVFTVVPLGGDVGGFGGGLGVATDGALWFVQRDGLAFGRITSEPAPTYTDAAALQVPAVGTTSGPASRYPATITASGHRGTVTGVRVRLNGIHHAFAADLTVQLVGPRGQSALLMANSTNRAGDLTTPRDVLGGEVITFTTGAPQAPRFLTSGVFSPVNGGGFAVNFPPPAVASPTGDLTVFNGTDPNGEWRLFVADDEPSAETTGVIAGGWSLDIQTTGVDAPSPPVVAAPPVADRTAPRLRLGRLPATVTLAALRRGLAVRVTSGEAATVRTSLRVRARGVTRGNVFPIELVRSTRRVSAGRVTRLLLTPGARRLGTPLRPFTVQLEVRATDAAGNRTTTRRTLRVTVPARR